MTAKIQPVKGGDWESICIQAVAEELMDLLVEKFPWDTFYSVRNKCSKGVLLSLITALALDKRNPFLIIGGDSILALFLRNLCHCGCVRAAGAEPS